jgi:membrane associated rhomboid family serine protease
MSKECEYCGFRDPMPFTCKFCGNSYCYNHRLPESHECTGLASFKKKVHESGKYYYAPDSAPTRRRSPAFRSLNNAISVIKSNYSLAILLIAIISFFLEYIIPGYSDALELDPLGIASRPWTLVTHIFLHAGPIHLLFNMMFLFFFGPELERRIGGKRFLIVFFLSGIIAAIGYSLWTVFVLQSAAPAVGASGALFGIFACLTVIAPDIQVYIYFIPMKITYALIFFALLDILLISPGDAIAHSAHLTGVVAGLVMGRYIKGSGRYAGY